MSDIIDPARLGRTAPKILPFINAVLGSYDGPIACDVGDHPTTLNSADEITEAAGNLRIQSLQPDGSTPFVWGMLDADEGDDWQACRLTPTAVLVKDTKALAFWAFDALYPQEALQPFANRFDGPFNKPLPAPGTDGWEVAVCDIDRFYTLAQFNGAYSEVSADAETAPEDDSPPWEDEPEATWADAKIKTPGYSVDDDPDMHLPYTITVGGSRDSMNWKPQTLPLGRIFNFLAEHKVGKKDGMSFVLGDMAPGMRKIDAVKSLSFVGLDIDTGMDGAELVRRVKELGFKTIIYTTHSHMKGMTEVRKDTMTRWAVKNEIDPRAQDLVQRYLQQEKHYDPAVAKTAEVFEERHQNEGITLIVHHAPMPKHRIVVPLASPFFIAKEGATQKDAQTRWRLIPEALARMLGDLPIDRTGSDANRLYYLPRHEKGAEFEISIFGGKLFDWTKVELGDPLAELAAEMNKGRSKSVTPEGRELGRWFMKKGHGFQIADVIRDNAPERVRNDMGTKIEVECPFDENHHNAGDPGDRACMVANAGDGIAESFVVSCRHEGCQDKTSLDMVGRMIADQWFERSVLEDENYNALAPEDAPNPAYDDACADLQIKPEVRETMIGVEGQRELALMTTDRRTFDGPDESNKFLKSRLVAVNQAGQHRLAVRTQEGVKLMKPYDVTAQYESFRAIWEENPIDRRTGKPSKFPKSVNVPAVPHFLKSADVRIFDGVVCDPTGRAAQGVLNTWQGIAKSPRKGGSTKLLHDHLLHSTAGGDKYLYDLCLDWHADMFQNPARKPSWSIAILGPKGVGKSTIGECVRKIIGRHHSAKITQQRHLIGNFNVHQADNLFLLAEEIIWGGDRQGTGVLNDLITSDSMMKEGKGDNAYEVARFDRVMFIAEPGWVVPAGPGERRYLVLQAVDRHAPKSLDHPDRKAYFGAIWNEFNSGGAEAFLAELLERDLSGFNPYGTPVTAALLEQVERTLPDSDRWLRNILAEGVVTDRENDPMPCEALDAAGNALPVSHEDFGSWPLEGRFRIETRHLKASYDAHVRRHGGSHGGDQAVMIALKPYGTVTRKRLKVADVLGRVWFYEFEGRQGWHDAFTAKWKLALN